MDELADRLRSPPRSSFLHSAHNTIYHEGIRASLDFLSSRDSLEDLVEEKGFERRWRQDAARELWPRTSSTEGGAGGAGEGGGEGDGVPRKRGPTTPASSRLRRAANRRTSRGTTYGPEEAAPRERPRRPSDAERATFLQIFSLLLAALAVVFAGAVVYGESFTSLTESREHHVLDQSTYSS